MTTKYILVPSHALIWRRLVDALSKQSFELQCVISTPSQVNGIKAFESVPAHSLWDLNHGFSPIEQVDSCEFNRVYNVLVEAGLERKIFEMMGRMEKISALPFYEKSSLLKLYIRYSLEILRVEPSFILFAESPHSPFTLTLMEVARVKSIKVVFGNNNPIVPTIFFDVDGELIPHSPTAKPEWLVALFEDWFARQTADYTTAIPLYMVRQQKRFRQQRLRNLIKGISRALRALTFKPRKEKPYLKFSGSESVPTFDVSSVHYIKRAFDQADQKLMESYERECDESWKKGGRPFVYLPLHYQPEMTSNPDGLTRYDQQNLIFSLRGALPKEYDLVVREHPSQFYLYDWANGFRSTSFYKSISKIDGVQLSSVHENPFELTDKCTELFTLTGSAALEACLRSRPASYFGRPWYRGCPSVRDLSNNPLLNLRVQEPAEMDEEGVYTFLKSRILEAPIGTVNPSNVKDFIDTPYSPAADDQIDEIANNLVSALAAR